MEARDPLKLEYIEKNIALVEDVVKHARASADRLSEGLDRCLLYLSAAGVGSLFAYMQSVKANGNDIPVKALLVVAGVCFYLSIVMETISFLIAQRSAVGTMKILEPWIGGQRLLLTAAVLEDENTLHNIVEKLKTEKKISLEPPLQTAKQANALTWFAVIFLLGAIALLGIYFFFCL